MNTLRGEGKRLSWTNSTGADVAVSAVVVLKNMIAVAVTAIANAATGAVALTGEHVLAAVSAESWAMGAKLYWDATAAKLTQVAVGNTYAGRASAAKAGSATTATVLINDAGGGEFYANAAASAVVTNTTDETDFSKKHTVDGTQLAAGDVIRIRAQGIVLDQNSTDTLNVKLYVGSEEIVATGAVDVADNDIFYIDADIVVRVAGASGKLIAAGVVALGVEGTVTAEPFKKAEASEDVSGDTDVKLSATWSVAHADNQVRLDVLTVQVLR